MKIAKRILSLVVAVLMVVGTLAVAASAAGGLAANISGSSYTMTDREVASVTIDHDFVLDLGGYFLRGEDGKAAITVTNGATVTIKNGQVASFFGDNVPTLDMIKTVDKKSPSGIVATDGANVTLENVRVLGGLTRIPSTQDRTMWSQTYHFPTGTAVAVKNGAKVTLKNVSATGDYGVNNNVTGSQPGSVEIEDAIVIGFVKAIKGDYTAANTAEEVNAADRIVGYLNDGVKLNEGEQSWLKKIAASRALIFTTKPTEDAATVSIHKDVNGDPVEASVQASVIEDLAANSDCSYRYIPESVIVTDLNGKTVETALDDDYYADLDPAIAETAEIRYRLEFDLQDDIYDYVKNFKSYVNAAFNKAVKYANELYGKDGLLGAYTYYTRTVKEAFAKIEKLGNANVTINGTTYLLKNQYPGAYYRLERALIELGGVTMYNGAQEINETGVVFYDGMFTEGKLYDNGRYAAPSTLNHEIIYADGEVGDRDVLAMGTLDYVVPIMDELQALVGETPNFADTSKWGDYLTFICENYAEVLDLIRDAQGKLENLNAMLDDWLADEDIDAVLDAVGDDFDVEDLQDTLELAISYCDDLFTVYDKALAYSSTIRSAKAELDENVALGIQDAYNQEYAAKIAAFLNNPETYVKPDDFIDGTFIMAYSLIAPTVKEYTQDDEYLLDLTISGSGSVTYDTAYGTKTTITDALINYDTSIALTAAPADGYDFLFWVNVQSKRIITTNTTLVWTTKQMSFVNAVFAPTSDSVAYFVNASGFMHGSSGVTGGEASLANISDAYVVNYSFDGWGASGIKSGFYAIGSIAAPQVGDSAFDTQNVVYDTAGYTLDVSAATTGKYIVTPKYSTESAYTVTFNDAKSSWTTPSPVTYGYRVTYTADATKDGQKFSYWVNKAGQIVSLTEKYSYQVIQAEEFTAVYGATAPAVNAYITLYSVSADAKSINWYAERATSQKILSTGMIISFDPEVTDPKEADVISNDLVKKGTSGNTNKQGVYTVSTFLTSGQQAYPEFDHTYIAVRPFVETASGMIYGDVVYYYDGAFSTTVPDVVIPD